jgi:hypothetical protein
VAEAPAVAQLAQDNPDLHVLGLGAQDSLDFANEFVARGNLADSGITLVWDPSFDSWREFGIRSQPYWILYDAQGNEVTSRPGSVDLGAVRAVLDA